MFSGKLVLNVFFQILLLTTWFATAGASEPKKLKILTSFLPVYIFTANVVGDRDGVEVDCLIKGDADPHNYFLRPSDLKKIYGADKIIINGLGIEGFLDGLLDEIRSKGRLFDSSKGLEFIKADVDGEEHYETHGHGHDHNNEVNPHTWVSPKVAAQQVMNIALYLSEIDPDGAHEYMQNASIYLEKLKALASQLKSVVIALPDRRVVAFHNAFDYLARDAGLMVVELLYETPGEEPSAGKLNGIVRRMKKDGVRIIISEPQYPGRLPGLLAKETGAKVIMLDPVATGLPDRAYYESVMKQNIKTLRSLSTP